MKQKTGKKEKKTFLINDAKIELEGVNYQAGLISSLVLY